MVTLKTFFESDLSASNSILKFITILPINNFILAFSNFRCHLHGRRVGKKHCPPCTKEYFIMVTCNSPCDFKSTVILDASAKEVERVRHICETGYSLVFYVYRSEAVALLAATKIDKIKIEA